MQLIDMMQQIAQQSQQASQPTELCTGTVVSASPLEITVDTTMAPLRAPVLYLTSAVVEKKITTLKHTHQIEELAHSHLYAQGQTQDALESPVETEPALEAVVCLENGAALPKDAQYITLNRALAAGDKVLLLRVQHGQKFIVLSRIFEGGGA